MKKYRFLIPAAFVCLSIAPAQAGNEASHAHWGYTGQESAQHWGTLDEVYHACKAGVEQSPVNITQYAEQDLPDLETQYQPAPLHVVNNGHTIQVNYAPGSHMSVDHKTFQLLQLHFHTPSEHYLDGAPYPMEVHFVHKAEDGTLGVVGAMMEIGQHNPVIEGIWNNAPATKGDKEVEGVALDARSLMPDNLAYYAYNGSLTTPPCSEGVKWHVLKDPIEISEAQLVTFQNMFPVNARPVQPLHERVIKGD